MKRLGILAIAAAMAVLPVVATAQEAGDSDMQESPYMDSEAGWRSKRFHVGASFGNLAGSTGIGSTQSLFAATQFEVGSDSAWSLRVGYNLAPRFEVIAEYGQSSPGLEAILTDLRGQGRTVVEFADLDYSYVGVSVLYSVVERTRRIAPFLSLGLVSASADSSDLPQMNATELALLFGVGMRIRVIDNVAIRSDVRGLRIGFGAKQADDEAPGFLSGDLNASHLVWGIGLDIRL